MSGLSLHKPRRSAGTVRVNVELVQGRGQVGALGHPAASRRGKHPFGIAVVLPEGAQADQERIGNRHLAVPESLAAHDPQHAARSVDVTGLEPDGLIQAARPRSSPYGLRYAPSKTPPSLGVFRQGAGRSGTSR